MDEQGVEQEARSLGWKPREEFQGDPERWADAETFLERGQTIMPLLKKTNERLTGEVNQLRADTARLKELFSASQEAIEGLKAAHTEATKAAVARAKANVIAELRQAKVDGDVEREVALTEQLTDIKVAERSKPAPQAKQPAQNPEDLLHPDFRAWASNNTWFGTDQRKTSLAMSIAQKLRSDPTYDHLQGAAFYGKVTELMGEQTSGGSPQSRVAAGGRGGSGGSGGRSYSDLPTEAKEACDRQGRRLVGEGRAFKDEKAWRAHYATMYFSGE